MEMEWNDAVEKYDRQQVVYSLKPYGRKIRKTVYRRNTRLRISSDVENVHLMELIEKAAELKIIGSDKEYQGLKEEREIEP